MNKVKKKKTLSYDFKHFVEHHTELEDEQKEYVLSLFKQDHIKKTVRMSLILALWIFFGTSLDAALFSSALVMTAVNGFSVLNFLPSAIFFVVNIGAKLLFFRWFDSERHLTDLQYFLASLPSVGIFLFLSSVLKGEKLFLKTLRSYFKYVRKRGMKVVIDLLNLKSSSQ